MASPDSRSSSATSGAAASDLPPDRGHLSTEQRLDASAELDALDITQTLELINAQDALIPGVIRQAIPDIAAVIGDIVAALRAGGRLIYLGAGTSGRLGVLDASECPPTFCSDPNQVVGIIAGGDRALRQSSEGREDEADGAGEELARLNVGNNDVVVGIAAGGTTPYVLGGLRLARTRGARTALLCCVQPDQLPASAHRPDSGIDHRICLPVGPEVLTGSTRLKAGTATKLALNMLTTTAMAQLGKAWGNLMVDVRATNAKLRDRAARILTQQCPDLTRAQAFALLDKAEGKVKLALVMHRKQVDATAAQCLLDEHRGRLRPILGNPR